MTCILICFYDHLLPIWNEKFAQGYNLIYKNSTDQSIGSTVEISGTNGECKTASDN